MNLSYCYYTQLYFLRINIFTSHTTLTDMRPYCRRDSLKRNTVARIQKNKNPANI